jgi:hypothetical protein
MYSQCGEDVILLQYISKLGLAPGNVVDLGAGDGFFRSNARMLMENGWTGHLYDGNASNDVNPMWITLETIANLDSVPCDILSIDLDGNDFWILNRFLLTHKPAIIVAEINPIFDRSVAAVMPYDANHVWANDTYYGMSLAAVEALALTHGYTVAKLHCGLNAFLVRNDLDVDAVREPLVYTIKKDHAPSKKWNLL